jgi:hypothetical protein
MDARPQQTRIAAMTIAYDDDDNEPAHAASSTAAVIADLELYGYRPSGGEPDPRPLPDDRLVGGAVADIFDALIATLAETPLETDLEDLLWGQVNLFHRAVGRIERELDTNEAGQKQSQREQDGTELRSVELERLIVQGQNLIERRGAMEGFRDAGVDLYERHVGVPWRPRTGSLVQHRALTAAMIDSRDFLDAKRRTALQPLIPAGTKIAFTGGLDCNDHNAIWTALDKARSKYPDMVLMHGGAPKGAECIAAAWARNRGVTEIVFKPDWARHAKAAPFKRNDAMLEALPTGLIAFPGSGISSNLADKARKLGIPVWTFG